MSLIDLKTNGRLFPLWVLKNFKKYRLPEIIRKDGEDPCDEQIKEELTLYQQFIGQYLNYRSPFKDILIFHGVGSGKTASAYNLYNILYNYTPKWNIFILIPASLRFDPWMIDFEKWVTNNKEEKMRNITFVHFDSPFADKDFLEKVKKKDASRDTVYIFDEVHKFMVNVYNNVSTKQGKRASVIYDYIQQEKKENPKTRVVLMSATPTVNQPFEWALIFNLLRPGTFPSSEAIFNQTYISSANYKSINEETKNMFQRRILGLVSYYIGATPDKFAQKNVHYKNVTMGKYHEEIYNYFEEIEEKKEKLAKIRGNNMSTYKSYTRQTCNFVFPTVDNFVSGQRRPRQGQFRIKETDEIIINEGREGEKISKLIKIKENNDYKNALHRYEKSFDDYLNDIHNKDKDATHTIKNDVEKFIKTYNFSFSKFLKEEKKKSGLFDILYNCGPKYMHIIFNTIKSKGPVLVYSNYVEMEGLAIFKTYLKYFGYVGFNEDDEMKNIDFNKLDENKKYTRDKLRYMEFHGGIDKNLRKENKDIFNLKQNRYGKIMKIIMISPAGAEGLNLKSIRQIHILEPFWNEVKIEQVIGRGIRICSHKFLPIDERKVDVFRYKMVRTSGKETADETLEKIARKKNNLMLSFTEAVKEASVDCELFKEHNMMGSKYKCFQFNQGSFFEDPIGPAFNPIEELDIKTNNGLNSEDSYSKKIKVMEIEAVYPIGNETNSTENNSTKFSEVKKYWYDEKDNVVFDHELNYPVGRLEIDKSGNPNKINKTVYIITEYIQIPDFEIYE